MEPALVYLVVGLALLLGVLLPKLTAQRAVSPPLILLAVGVGVGLAPLGLGDLAMVHNPAIVEHVTEFTIIIALTGVGLALDRPLARARDTWRCWSSTWRLLGIAMPLAIVVMALLGHALMGLGAASALLLASALAPTDPVLASDVQVAGPTTDVDAGDLDEDDEVRFALTSEAGLNDGMAFPFVTGALFLAGGESIGWHWVAWDLIGKTVIGVAVGYVVGWLLARVAFRAPRAVNLSRIGDPLLVVCCPLIAYGLGETLHGWGFVAVFITAITMRAGDPAHEYHVEMHSVADRMERTLTLVVLLMLGAALAGGLLRALTWQGALMGVLLVFVVRPVTAWIALWTPSAADFAGHGRLGPRERMVTAFFGVRGLGTVYYLAWATGRHAFPHQDQLWSAAAFTIALSVIVHGVLATPIVGRLDSRRSAAEAATA